MKTVNVHEAKTHLSRLIAELESGSDDVIIARAGKPVARLTRVPAEKGRRVLGRDAGLFEVPDDFDEPLPLEVLKEFEQ